jgi:hypothetical protein
LTKLTPDTSSDSSAAVPFIPHSASTPPTLFRLFKKQHDRSPIAPATDASPARPAPRSVTFLLDQKTSSASKLPEPPAPFDPFSGVASEPPAPEFVGVVDFDPILKEYVRPLEDLEDDDGPEVPAIRPFPRFETTVAAEKLAAFVKAEFGITASFTSRK